MTKEYLIALKPHKNALRSLINNPSLLENCLNCLERPVIKMLKKEPSTSVLIRPITDAQIGDEGEQKKNIIGKDSTEATETQLVDKIDLSKIVLPQCRRAQSSRSRSVHLGKRDSLNPPSDMYKLMSEFFKMNNKIGNGELC